MSAEASLDIIYDKAIQRYEQLYKEGKIDEYQLALIKRHTGLSDVVFGVRNAKARNERERTLRDRLFHTINPQVITRLERFSAVVHTAVQSNPSLAALVWSSIKFVHIILTDVHNAYAKACSLLEAITLSLERFSAYVEALGVTELLRARLVSFYEDVIEFGLDVVKFYGRSRIGSITTAVCGSLQQPFDDMEEKIRLHSAQIDLAAQADHMKLAADGFARLESIQNNLQHNWPRGIFNVPDQLSKKFTGRIPQLEDIHTMISESPSKSKRVAVYGMPGAGKTQLMLKAASDFHEVNPICNIFYIDASRSESLVQGFQVIHALLNLHHEPRQAVMIEKVKDWLTRCYPGGWMLLVDNVVSTRIIQQHLPAGDSGIILFTMRDELAAMSLATAGKLELACMDTNDAVDLILKTANIEKSTASDDQLKHAAELGHEVGGLPLALDQSATCIYQRQWSLPEYLDILRYEKTTTLRATPNADTPTVYDVFALALMNLDPVAAVLLKLLVYLDWHNIPTALLKVGAQNIQCLRPPLNVTTSSHKSSKRGCVYAIRAATRMLCHLYNSNGSYSDTTEPPQHSSGIYTSESCAPLRQLFSCSEEIENAISNLRAAALIGKSDGNICIHDLVYQMTLDRIEESERPLFAKLAVLLCVRYFPATERITDPESWKECAEVSTHALVSLRNIKNLRVSLGETHHLQSQLALYYDVRARHDEALDLFWDSLDGFNLIYGPEHQSTLNTMRSIGDVFFHQACHDEMLEWYGQGPDSEMGVHGNANRQSRQAIDMAAVTRSQKQHKEALLHINDDPPRPRTADSEGVSSSQTRFAHALQWYSQALRVSEKVHGENDPFTMRCLRNTVTILLRQKQYKQAEILLKPTLDRARLNVHPSAASTFGTMFYLQDRYDEALEWYMYALEGYKMSCGSSHPQALVSFYNVASAHLGKENYKEAREKFEIAVVGQRKVLGLEHPDTVKTEKAITYTEEIMAAHDSKE